MHLSRRHPRPVGNVAVGSTGCRSRVGRSVHLPEVHDDLSSARILTMEFASGHAVADSAGLQRAGIAPAAVARLVAQAFNEMIFLFGDVHCDPHAANMLVRCDAASGLQLVLLDHGLYRSAPAPPIIHAALCHTAGRRSTTAKTPCLCSRKLMKIGGAAGRRKRVQAAGGGLQARLRSPLARPRLCRCGGHSGGE